MSALLPLPRDRRLTEHAFFKHWIAERVRWSDTDQVGHVNNVSFATYCECARTEVMRPLLSGEAPERAMLLVAQLNLSFIGEIHWPAQVDIGSVMLEIGGSSCRLGHGLFVGDRCVGTADTVLVNIDETTRKPHPIGGPTRDYLNRFLADPAA